MKKIFNQTSAAFRVGEEPIQVKDLPFCGPATLSNSPAQQAAPLKAMGRRGRDPRGEGVGNSGDEDSVSLGGVDGCFHSHGLDSRG